LNVLKRALKKGNVMKSIEQIIDDQVKRWEMMRAVGGRVEGAKPVITFSREPGSGGSIVAKELAEQLGLDFFHREIIQKMAESASISKRLMEILDEKDITILDDWISTLVNAKHLWPDQYLRHLLNVIGAIGRHGGAVIVGRGSCFILTPDVNFRVRVVAPLETRAQNVARQFEVPLNEARRRVLKTELDRSAFVRKYFHKDVAEAVNYDLVLNTGNMSIGAAVDAIKGALGGRCELNEGININLAASSSRH
jgi:cytidylate kinase